MTYVASVSIDTMILAAVDLSRSSSAAEIASLLFKASPANAKDFALSMHERVAWGLDPTLIEHWASVAAELVQITRASASVTQAAPKR